jgi:hypothetical protein
MTARVLEILPGPFLIYPDPLQILKKISRPPRGAALLLLISGGDEKELLFFSVDIFRYFV